MSELKNSQSSSTSTAYSETTRLLGTAASRRSQHLLAFTIDALLKRIGIANAMFVTLTFARPARSTKTAHAKLNSLMNAVRKRYGGYLWVLQPHKSGSIHYHLLIPVDFDCHASTDLDAWDEKSYSMEGQYFRSEDPDRCGVCTRDNYQRNSMSAGLRAEDDWWQAAAKAHGFGRVQVAPIYGGAEAVRKYMTNQDWRTRLWPFKETKNIRLWSCSQNLRSGNVKFAWTSPRAKQGRQRMAEWARGYGCDSEADLPIVLGPQWNLVYMREVVWGQPPRINSDAPLVGKTCPFPPRRYSDPDFQPHPGLFEHADNNIVGISQPLIPPPLSPTQASHAVLGGAGGRREPPAKRQGTPAKPPEERHPLSRPQQPPSTPKLHTNPATKFYDTKHASTPSRLSVLNCDPGSRSNGTTGREPSGRAAAPVVVSDLCGAASPAATVPVQQRPASAIVHASPASSERGRGRPRGYARSWIPNGPLFTGSESVVYRCATTTPASPSRPIVGAEI